MNIIGFSKLHFQQPRGKAEGNTLSHTRQHEVLLPHKNNKLAKLIRNKICAFVNFINNSPTIVAFMRHTSFERHSLSGLVRKLTIALSKRTARPASSHSHWPRVLHCVSRLSIYLLLAGFLIFSFNKFEELNYQNYLRDKKLDATVELIDVRERMENSLYARVMDVTEMTMIVSENLQISTTEFNLKAIDYVLDHREILSISMAPNLVVEKVFPRFGNEHLIGKDIWSSGNDRERIDEALKSAEGFITGPADLGQGIIGVTLHRPVYAQGESGGRHLWGVVSFALDYEKLLEKLNIPEFEDKYDLLIQEKHANDSLDVAILYGDRSLTDANPIRLNFRFPFGQWELAATSDGGWPTHKPGYMSRWYTSTLIIMVCLGALWYVLRLIEGRLKAEKILSTGIEALDHGFVMFDADRRLIAFNEKYKQLAGGSGMVRVGSLYEDIVKANLESGLIPDAVGREEEWYEKWSKRLEDRSSDNEQILADGRLIRAYDRPMKDGSVVGLRIDITDLKEAQNLAEAANRAKTDFMGVLSHELRTPLTVILGNAKLAKNISKMPAYKKLVERMQAEPGLHDALGPLLETVNSQIVSMMGSLENSGGHLLGLISEILDFAKIESGNLELEKLPTSTEQIVRTVIDQLRPVVEHKGLEFVTNVDDVALLVDTKRVQQVLFNIIGNAAKFTESGVITLDVFKKDNAVIFSVTDTGIGIPEDQLDKVFEAFQQVDLSANRKYNGTGLGLAIARDMAVAHSGQLTVQSKFEVGSTFTLSLPAPSVTAKAEAHEETPQSLVA